MSCSPADVKLNSSVAKKDRLEYVNSYWKGSEIYRFSSSGTQNFLHWLKKTFMAPFYGWGSTASRLEPLRGGSLLFITKFPEIPGTHFIDLLRTNVRVDLGTTQWF